MSVPAINPTGGVWMSLRRWNLERIAAWRKELESLTVTPDRAHQLRGMIYALTEQMEHVEPTPQPEVKDENYG